MTFSFNERLPRNIQAALKILLICFALVMASANSEAQEMATKKTLKQEEEEEETSDMPVQEKEATAKQGFSNRPAALLCDRGMEKYHLLPLPAGDRIQTINNKPSWQDGYPTGSVEGGWLIHYRNFARPNVQISGYEDEFLCYNYVSFLNPFSGAKLDLPPEPCFLTRRDLKPHFSADLITSNCSPDSPDFFTVAFFLNSNRHWLAFCRIEDESWTRIADIKHARDASTVIQLALALDDKNKLLYFLHLNPSVPNCDLLVFDLKDSKNIKRKRLVMAGSNCANVRDGLKNFLSNGDRKVFLVADSSYGDLFTVFQVNDIVVLPDGFSSNVLPVKLYGVFIKLDEGGGPRWREIRDLGDRSFFISYWGSRVISTAELNNGSKSEDEFIKGNCIYFALQDSYEARTSLRRDIGVFSLTDGSIRHFPLDHSFLKNPLRTLWFTPGSNSS